MSRLQVLVVLSEHILKWLRQRMPLLRQQVPKFQRALLKSLQQAHLSHPLQM